MKLTKYYIAFILPILIIVLIVKLGFDFIILPAILFYYTYRCFLDYYRLSSNGYVTKKDVWKFVLPIWTFLYFEELYLKK